MKKYGVTLLTHAALITCKHQLYQFHVLSVSNSPQYRSKVHTLCSCEIRHRAEIINLPLRCHTQVILFISLAYRVIMCICCVITSICQFRIAHVTMY